MPDRPTSSGLLTQAAADLLYQGLSSVLTALAALTITSTGTALLQAADAAAARTTLGVRPGVEVQAYDAALGPPPLVAFWGDGSDGAAVFDGVGAVTGFSLAANVYTATTAKEFQFSSMSVATGVTVKTAGCPILVAGTLTMTGTATLSAAGNAAAADTGGAASHSLSSTRLYPGLAGANGRTTSGNGAAGSSGAANTNAVSGASGAGGNATNTGGAAGTATQWDETRGSMRRLHEAWIMWVPPVTFAALAGAPGAGAGAALVTSGPGASGGGGGGGGVLLVRAKALVCTGAAVFTAAGGAGGNATATGATVGTGGGGGGGGGFVSCAFDTITGAPTFSAAGGNGGNAASAGGVSANGGASGSGGKVWVGYRTTGSALTLTVTAGTPGSGAGGGSTGASGSAGAAIEADL